MRGAGNHIGRLVLNYLAIVLVVTGTGVLSASLLSNHKLVATLPPGSLRNQWRALMALVMFFIAGYVSYLFLFADLHGELVGLLVPFIFLFGACFVLLTAKLALHTAEKVRRIALLEIENVTDPLTKLFNRRYLDRRLDEEVARATRYGTPLSVMLLDIDNFKNVNDIFGHELGDYVLVHLAETVTRALRETDFVARYGGEEFVVVAPLTALADAALIAERLREVIAASTLIPPPKFRDRRALRITISVGVASLSEKWEGRESLMHAADMCLYRAKRLGRNRIATTAASEQVTASEVRASLSAA